VRDHPDYAHGDLNLGQRGYAAAPASAGFVDLGGGEPGAPQLSALFRGHGPHPIKTYRVYDWNWGCGAHGCRGDLLANPEVTLLGLAVVAGEELAAPRRDAEVYGGGYNALVLYAEPTRLTLSYCRDGTVANGYVVQLEGLCVDPNLLAVYRACNAAGRGTLPGLHAGEVLGTAAGGELKVAVRDRGTFMDPRSRGEWWR
jgi:hypothetical protein